MSAKISPSAIAQYNEFLKDASPEQVVSWTTTLGGVKVVTTNFGPLEASLLHLVYSYYPTLPVIWCDTGYNTIHTYHFARKLQELLKLTLKIYVPKTTVGYRNSGMGLPTIEDPDHREFTREVKLEPFERAMAELAPAIWFTNIRKGQTALRDNLDIVSLSRNNILRVSPFFHWSDTRLSTYLKTHGLPDEPRYFDPTKVKSNRECGIHS